MPPASSRVLTFALGFSFAAAGAAQVAGACAGDLCPAASDDVAALLQSSQASARVQKHAGQRSDDFVPGVTSSMTEVQPPPTETPGAFDRHLPLPTLLPAPNPAMSPFIANYTPQNCMMDTKEDKWPFFRDVVGTWAGHNGQNFIALPQVDARPMGKNFLVQVNNYSEELHFVAIGGPVLNRGYLDGVQVDPTNQSDQVLTGVLYEQTVMDNDLMMGIHEENGQILHKACAQANSFVTDDWNILRQGAIPHGSQPMGYGNLTTVKTPDSDYYVQMLLRVRMSYEFSVQPFVPGCGPQKEQQESQGMGTANNVSRVVNTGPLAGSTAGCCIGTSNYMRGTDQCPPTGCPEPIDTLIDAVRDLNVIKYVQLNLSTAMTIPPTPRGDFFPGMQGGGVQNTGFVNAAAAALPQSFRNLVWLLTVQKADGSTYQLLQYIQTVNLRFLAAGPGCPDQLWPHVDANTLKKMP